MKDYIIVRYEDYDFNAIFLYDHELTNGEIEKVTEAISNYDSDTKTLEEAINEALPYIDYITISDDDDYHTIWC